MQEWILSAICGISEKTFHFICCCIEIHIKDIMKETLIKDIKKYFIQLYKQHGFIQLPQGSLLDPSLPMTFVGSAGLSQIEQAIEAGEDRAGEKYVLVQPCFRHFDMKKVGSSPVHLSLFEMGGAFYFGDVPKEDVLSKIWRFFIEQIGLEPERIWVTYFTGGELDGHCFEAEEEILNIWKRLGVCREQIVGAGIDKGFWKQGGGIANKERFRKCGPTTEIFYDRSQHLQCGNDCWPGCPCGRFIEISNILFIHSLIDQETHALEPLVTPFAETVIGVERVAMAAQQNASVFDADGLALLIQQVRQSHNSPALLEPEEITASERIIIDHLQALLFLIADGAPPPGKGGQKRIIKSLIRGLLTRLKMLEISRRDFLEHLLDKYFDVFTDQHTFQFEKEKVLTYCKNEEKKFEHTLTQGHHWLEEAAGQHADLIFQAQQLGEFAKQRGIPFSLLKIQLMQRGVSFAAGKQQKNLANPQQEGRQL